MEKMTVFFNSKFQEQLCSHIISTSSADVSKAIAVAPRRDRISFSTNLLNEWKQIDIWMNILNIKIEEP